ncbi:hypothetical protein FOTG_19170 [Fusarium oxysporum f. sp. vasinfectum 25433]|uniref:Uncharacterized protein n=1 Tax=Fusarium oxysporum f. sp. vasinfectum 25433 TaxID=1089449 RepID=X0KFI5_FUSOX|nr:hypothetical protein FOTG_19170 [Fusarium oxysporum f. sp. vasinfectum 25433]
MDMPQTRMSGTGLRAAFPYNVPAGRRPCQSLQSCLQRSKRLLMTLSRSWGDLAIRWPTDSRTPR